MHKGIHKQPDVRSQTPPLNPGDDATEGTPGSGEDICSRCHGRGTLGTGQDCPDCGGTGRVIEGIGGG
jgi:RecJ-like exonuclease